MKQLSKFFPVAIGALSLVITSCSKDKDKTGVVEKLSPTVVLQWNETAFEAFGGPLYDHSLMASRINAMTHIAMHDALNAIQPVYATYAFNGRDTGADPVTAAATAAHAVLLHEIPAKKSFLDSALAISLLHVPAGNARTRGTALGQQAAQAIIQSRNNDGAKGELIGPVPPSNTPGVYQAVPPFDFVFAPQWAEVKLFSLQSTSQFRSAPLPGLNSTTYTNDFNEVKATGQFNSDSRTPDQTAYAKFWYEFSEAGWNRVARTVITNKKLNLLEAARLMALTDMAIADAYIAGWDSKFHYNFWRPYTAIRNAANDGNDNTLADTQWEPAEATPPVQDYPSTHSALGNAGATVLARLLGDHTPFTMTSFTAFPQGATRTFNSFSQAANENADSRVRAGIHFRFSCLAGQTMGNQIGNYTVDTHLKKLP